MLIPFLYGSTKRQRSVRRGGERVEKIGNEEEEVEKEERGKSQVCSIHKKKENELIVALTATAV